MDELQVLVAEAEIGRVTARYCRAIDRMDEALLRSCYHPGATDEHGSFRGDVDEYVTWVWRLLERYRSTMHLIGNQLVELDAPDLDIDQLADRVARAAELVAVCRSRIDEARMRVTEIVADLDEMTSED